MDPNNGEFNYIFVSDFHVAAGIDPKINVYHPREDFYFDEEFLRFLVYMDQHREDNDKNWELIFNGDCFDFLPVETDLKRLGVDCIDLYQ